jgi:hypothetical protein
VHPVAHWRFSSTGERPTSRPWQPSRRARDELNTASHHCQKVALTVSSSLGPGTRRSRSPSRFASGVSPPALRVAGSS